MSIWEQQVDVLCHVLPCEACLWHNDMMPFFEAIIILFYKIVSYALRWKQNTYPWICSIWASDAFVSALTLITICLIAPCCVTSPGLLMRPVMHICWHSVIFTIIAYFLQGLGTVTLLLILTQILDYLLCFHCQFGLSGIFTVAFWLGCDRFITATMGLIVAASLAATTICTLSFVCILCRSLRGWGMSLWSSGFGPVWHCGGGEENQFKHHFFHL